MAKGGNTVRLRNTRPGVGGLLQIGPNPEELLEHGQTREYPSVVLENPSVRVWLKAGWVQVV